MLYKQDKYRDGVSISNVSVADLKSETFDFFRNKDIKSKRLDSDVLAGTNEALLNNLKLTVNNYLST